MIEIAEISKRYGDVQAVSGLSLLAGDGAITALVGGNGSGKSTTLRAVAGLIRPDSGRVTLAGVDVRKNREAALRTLGFFPDQFGLYPRLTAREHLEIFARLHGFSGRRLKVAVDATVAELAMGDIATRRTQGFSQGQRMKVALGRAIVHRPMHLVLDEPTRGLDLFAVRQLRRTLAGLRAQGTCILLSSHVAADIEELADRVVVVANGRIVTDGTVAELKERAAKTTLEDALVALMGREPAREYAA